MCIKRKEEAVSGSIRLSNKLKQVTFAYQIGNNWNYGTTNKTLKINHFQITVPTWTN